MVKSLLWCLLSRDVVGVVGKDEYRLGGGTPRWYGLSDDLSLAITRTPGSVYPRSINSTPFSTTCKTQRWPYVEVHLAVGQVNR